jgi:adenylate cyclase
MLTPRGPRILDFGVSAVRESVHLTRTGELVGTPFTMSPEQFRGQSPDQRSDLWALGVILYEALTGVRPFAGESYAAIAHRVLNEEPVSPSTRNPAIRGGLERVIAKLLAKDAAQRYARAEDVLSDLVDGKESSTAVAAAREIPRLAVLYFEVLSSEPDDQFLAAGLTEDLIVDLARVPGLTVSARGEVLPYRERGLPPRTVARELGVSFVVQGSVRRAGVRGRISAQLVRAADGHAIWAERFDRTLEDLFDVQAEVSKSIVGALEITLRPAERAILDRAPTQDREAYAFYLRGRTHDDDRRRASSRRAEECFRQAVTLDPGFALAHAALAQCLAQRCLAWWAESSDREQAAQHARRALDLDPQLPEAHMALGMAHRAAGNPAAALAEVKAAQMMDSNSPEIIIWIGRSYMAIGQPEEAIPILERGLDAHPRDYKVISTYADCSDMLGRKDVVAKMLVRLREVLMEVLERQPDDTFGRSVLGIALAQAGDHAAGVGQTERALAEDHEDWRVLYGAACTFAYAGLRERAMEQLRRMVGSYPGYQREWAWRDPDLAPLRDLSEFVELFGPH